jgi:hypothetical protein
MATDLSTVYALLGTAIGISVAALVLTILLGMVMWRRYKQSAQWLSPTWSDKAERPLLPLAISEPNPTNEAVLTSSPSDWLVAFPPQQEEPMVPAAVLPTAEGAPASDTQLKPSGAMFYDNF